MADIRTEMVEFRSNGSTTPGFLARPEGDGPFPGVIVIQEWWGLNDNIKDIAQRLAHEGYAAFAPDLYHGRMTREPDQAQKMMMQLDMPLAAKELVKATEYLAAQKYINGRRIGATGSGTSASAETTPDHAPAALTKAPAPIVAPASRPAWVSDAPLP
mgnify:CR=1 FL=1